MNSNIDTVAFIQEAVESNNLAASLPDGLLDEIAMDAKREYELDKESMSDWRTQMERGIELAKLEKKDKSYPFEGSANVKYPLITTAALQFNARAYPAICAPSEVVKAKVHGQDPQGMKASRAERISSFMSWQLSAQIEEWEEETDKLLVQLPIVGQMYRKIWYDPSLGRIRCKMVAPGDFIINDNVTLLEDAPRCTEVMELYPQEISERERDGRFLEIEYTEGEQDNDSQAPEQYIEQHRRIDLDRDGYAEPYIVTVHLKTEKVVRLVADFDIDDVSWEMGIEEREEPVADPMTDQPLLDRQTGVMATQLVQYEVPVGVRSIKRGSYFISYQFMPGMGGGFNGTGLGLLLGDISESINSILNMLIDAGHRSSMGGGFVGQELKFKGGGLRFRPGEWKLTSSRGGEIRNSIVPITFPEPNAVLFQMFGVLVEAGREIASVKDIMTGDSGERNMTATTTLALIEQGMMVFTAAYKRIFRSLKREFQLIARLNEKTVDPEMYAAFHDAGQMGHNGGPPLDPAQEFASGDMDIEPVADPQSVTKMQQGAKAQLLLEMAAEGHVDRAEAVKRILEATDIGDVEELQPKPDPMQQQMMQLQMQVEQAKAQSAMMKAQADTVKAQAELMDARKPASEEQRLRFEAEKAEAEMRLERTIEMARLAQEEFIAMQEIASKERIASKQIEASARNGAE